MRSRKRISSGSLRFGVLLFTVLRAEAAGFDGLVFAALAFPPAAGFCAEPAPCALEAVGVASARSPVKRSTPKRSEPLLMRFRLRMSQIEGSRSRSIVISATSDAEARSLAAEEAGEGWKIIECAPATDQGF